MSWQERKQFWQNCVEDALEQRLPVTDDPKLRELHQALYYSVLGGGKRTRPILVYAAGELAGAPLAGLHGPACAVEMIHAYSLIHDDLPAMDDSNERRGQPACHCAYGEATAILCGDALQALAFQTLATDPDMPVSAERRLQMIGMLAAASGLDGMVGGQALDLNMAGAALDRAQLERIHRRKTGALIRASVLLGVLSGERLDAAEYERIARYAECIGLAFQVQDDLLDADPSLRDQTLGKPQGLDQRQGKATFPSLLGLSGAQKAAAKLCQEALEHLSQFGEQARFLRSMASYIIRRDH